MLRDGCEWVGNRCSPSVPRSAGAEDTFTFPSQALSAQEMQLTYMTLCLSAPQPNHTANLTWISAGLSTAWPALAARLSVCLRHQHGEHELSRRPVKLASFGYGLSRVLESKFQKKKKKKARSQVCFLSSRQCKNVLELFRVTVTRIWKQGRAFSKAETQHRGVSANRIMFSSYASM